MRILLVTILLFISSVACAQRQLTTIPINNTDPGQIKAAITPYLSVGSSVSFYQNQLILNVTADELEKTRSLLKQLDRLGRQLLISLRTEGGGSEHSRSIDIGGAWKKGNTTITTEKGGIVTQTNATVRVNDYSGTRTDKGKQRLRATEGMAAYISTGASAPIKSYTTGADGRRYYHQDYVDAVSGFYATTWVNDSIVRISIEQSNDKLQGQTISTQRLQSQVSGQLGQWIAIGVISEDAVQHRQNIGLLGQSSVNNKTELYIKVELVQ